MWTPVKAAAVIAGLLAASPAAADFASCVANLREGVVKAGVSRQLATRALDLSAPDQKVLRLSKVQPEGKIAIWDYMGFLVDEQRVADGREMMQKHAGTLRAAEQRFGVDRHVIAAIWGVESDYGREMGDSPLPAALATLICEGGRRASFFRGELVAALKLVDAGEITLDKLKGSWAGAFGQTQFIPTTYRRLAVDFDGDGRRDLVGSAADALGSTGNYLKRAGWQTGDTWMIEVRLPQNYRGASGRKRKAPIAVWAKRGILRADGSKLTGAGRAGLLLPAGAKGTWLSRIPQLRCDLRLQPPRLLRAGRITSGRPARRPAGAADKMADRRSGPVARSTHRPAEAADREGLPDRHSRREDRPRDARGDCRGGEEGGHEGDRAGGAEDLSRAWWEAVGNGLRSSRIRRPHLHRPAAVELGHNP